MRPKPNAFVFSARKNSSISLVTFWVSLACLPISMLLRGFLSGFDLFEQVLLFLSWYSIIETARNSVITSRIRQ